MLTDKDPDVSRYVQRFALWIGKLAADKFTLPQGTENK